MAATITAMLTSLSPRLTPWRCAKPIRSWGVSSGRRIGGQRLSSGSGRWRVEFTVITQETYCKSNGTSKKGQVQLLAVAGSRSGRIAVARSKDRPLLLVALPAFSSSSISTRGLPIRCCKIVWTSRPGAAFDQPRWLPTIPKLALSDVASTTTAGNARALANCLDQTDFPMPGGPSRSIGGRQIPGQPWRTDLRSACHTISVAGAIHGNSA